MLPRAKFVRNQSVDSHILAPEPGDQRQDRGTANRISGSAIVSSSRGASPHLWRRARNLVTP
jgi:hypothetical protein